MTTQVKLNPFKLIISVLSVSCIISTSSFAQSAMPVADTDADVSTQNSLQAGLNLMAIGSPYDVDNNVKVLPSLFFDNGKVYARGSQLGGYLINDKQNELAVFFQPAGFTFDPDDAKQIQRNLDEREWSGMAGVSYMRSTPIGGFRGRLSTDVVGNSDGTTAQLAYLARINKGKWTIYPSVGINWTDEKYNDYYYGISSKESANTGIKAYDLDSNITPYINLNGIYSMNDQWSLFVGQNFSYLSDEQSDSPIVDNRSTYRSTLGLLYKF